jgi:hypothetical protein
LWPICGVGRIGSPGSVVGEPVGGAVVVGGVVGGWSDGGPGSGQTHHEQVFSSTVADWDAEPSIAVTRTWSTCRSAYRRTRTCSVPCGAIVSSLWQCVL